MIFSTAHSKSSSKLKEQRRYREKCNFHIAPHSLRHTFLRNFAAVLSSFLASHPETYLNAERSIIKLPYKRTSLLSISHSRASPAISHPGDSRRERERPLFFSSVHTLSRSRTSRTTRAILKVDLSPRRKIRSRPTMGFPIAAVLSYRRSYRGSHTGRRLFRNRRTRRRLSTPAPPRLSRRLSSPRLPLRRFSRHSREKDGRKRSAEGEGNDRRRSG